MGTSNRAALLTKTHKTLKKHYTPAAPADRPLLAQLLLALCLENSTYDAAEKVMAELESGFFDWNEVRVSTVTELAELMTALRDARHQAANVKRALQSIFESTYSFDLEGLKKKNLGQAVKDLEKLPGVTPFAIAFVTQTSLGGHAIPLDRGALQALFVLGIASDKEAASGTVPGVERAIPKNKGVEFGSLLHQLGADLLARPFSNDVRDVFTSIAADAKERLPKRGAKKAAAPAEAQAKEEPAAAAAKSPAPAAKKKSKAKTETPPKKPAAKKPSGAKPAKDRQKPSGSKRLAKSKPR
jgi:endonuclease-3